MKKINKQTLLFFLIVFLLFVIPFFWLKPGEMDLGGDGHRLYFYDPLANLMSFAFYSTVPWGIAHVSYNQYFIPYILFIWLLKILFQSPTILISLFNGVKLAGAFIGIFLIVKGFFLKSAEKEMTVAQWCAAILAGLFYTLSSAVVDNLQHALFTHDQVFLYPMIFYLLLRYIITASFRYMWIVLLVTIVFSTSFSLQAPPPLFAFFPLTLLFLFLYNTLVLKKSIQWKGLGIGVLFFLGLHAFHLIPVFTNIFDKGSEFNSRIFEGVSNTNVGLEYFDAISQFAKVSSALLIPLEGSKKNVTLLVIPLCILLGFIIRTKKDRTAYLVGIFFLITLFLESANITHVGLELYRKLFYIPGFGMFRNFAGQWQWVYTFFYALLAGLSISFFFSKLKTKYIYIVSAIVVVILVSRSAMLFTGKTLHVIQRGSTEIDAVIQMDPDYEALLTYLRELPNDGKILQIPFTDFAYNLVGGKNNGVYVGQSMVSLLAGKNDYAGYQHIAPFSETFRELVHPHNYPLIKKMLSILQVRYVLYNRDEKISDTFFAQFPYGYTGIPASPAASLAFVQNITKRKIYEKGKYSLYEVDNNNYLPHFYPVAEITIYDTNPKYNISYNTALSFFPAKASNGTETRVAFIERNACRKILPETICQKDHISYNVESISIEYQRINPTKYRLHIGSDGMPFLIVFQDAYSTHWRIFRANNSGLTQPISGNYFSGSIKERIPSPTFIDRNPFETNGLQELYVNTHVQANGYANAWYIPSAPEGEVIVEMISQKLVYYSFGVTLITLVIFFSYGIFLFKKKV